MSEQEKQIYVTLKDLLIAPESALKNTEPRCFLCNQTFSGLELTAAIDLSSSKEKRYALFHENCFEIVMSLFDTFFRDFLFSYLIENGLHGLINKNGKVARGIEFIKL